MLLKSGNMKTLSFWLEIVVFVLISCPDGNCQIGRGGSPDNRTYVFSEDDIIVLPKVDQMEIQSIKAGNVKGRPLQFAYSINVNLNPQNSGKWYSLENGFKLWTVRIRSNGALSLHLFFDHYKVPQGARMFLFSPDKKYILGAFNELNNKESGVLTTQPIPGDEMIIQYIVPGDSDEYGTLSIGQIGHGFIPVFSSSGNKDGFFGGSGPCNVDVNCPDGALWQDHKRSVVRLLIDKVSAPDEICTGVIVNNTAQDGKPYLLTAGHCIKNAEDATRSLSVFGYESPVCDGPDGFVNLSLSGAVLKATLTNLDFTLAELTAYPPVYYQPYYAGWNAGSTAPQSSVSIHHPSGDVKKISVDNDPAVSASYDTYDPNTFWKILMWDVGTTEAGSSGGPLFDNLGRLVGTLSGGQAACGNSINDYFQKFSESWDRYPNPSEQLKIWLDPLNLGTTVLDGYDPYGSELTCDTVKNIQLQDTLVVREYSAGIPGDGLWSGHNAGRISQYAERITLLTGDEFVEALVHVGNVVYNSVGDSVKFKLWKGVDMPETLVISKSYALLYFQDSTEYRISFDTLVKFQGPFWLGYEISYDNPVSGPLTDQFSIFQAEPRGGSGQNTSLYFDHGTWIAFDTNALEPVKTSLAFKVRMCTNIPNLGVYHPGEPDLSGKIFAYPNPTSGELTLRFSERDQGTLHISIFSLGGVLLFNGTYSNVFEELTLSLPKLRTGIYAIRIEGRNHSETKKLMIIQ